MVCGHATELILDGLYDLRFGVPGLFQIRQCASCRLEQTAPVLAQAELAATYDRYYNFRDRDVPRYTKRRQQLLTARLYRPWVRLDGDVSFILRTGQGRLLDVGCNEGRNLQFYRAGGFLAEGVETNPSAGAMAQQLGFAVHIGALDTLPPSRGRYDVIVMSNVLEHVECPVRTLEEVHRRLAPGGEVWISCPNANSLARQWFGRSWINWHPPFHLAHFTADRLIGLLASSGFEIIGRDNVSPALWVAQSLIAHRYAQPGRPTLQMRNPAIVGPLLLATRGLLFPVLWAANRRGRGDCLRITARRRPNGG